MKVSIIIPNRNGARLLQKNLPSVLTAAKAAEVIVVDDASIDNSVEVLKERFPSIRVLRKQVHKGFASTVNAGVKEASGEIVVLLNTDVQPQKNFLDPLIKRFDDPTVFAVGCLEKSYERGNVVLRGRGEAKWEKGFFIHWRGEVDKESTAWVSGGSGAFRTSIWEKLGGMDPMYDPFYWEDIDLSYRALKAGYRVVFEQKSVVTHCHSMGTIQTEYSEEIIKRIAYRNQFIFIWKNLTFIPYVCMHIVFLPYRTSKALIYWDISYCFGLLCAIIQLPLIIKQRFSCQHEVQVEDNLVFKGQ